MIDIVPALPRVTDAERQHLLSAPRTADAHRAMMASVPAMRMVQTGGTASADALPGALSVVAGAALLVAA